ncbi:MAG: TPM domain-containing protein [Pyrinomonadaceae bacterium]|nr:TPM domain-containing protein [Pyrinomonadaceae bacterium]
MHKVRKSFLLLALVLVCPLFVAHQARAQNTPSPLPSPTGYVNDYAGVIDAATKSRIETILTNLDSRAKIEFSVVTVPTTGGQDIFDYSLAVMRGWGIGSADKGGLLLLIAVNDRKYFTQVSRHLEGDLTDSVVGEVGRRMREPFRAGNYSQGIMTAVQTLVATLAEKRGFSVEGIDQSYAYRGRQRPSNGGDAPQASLGTCCIIFVVLMFLLLFLSRNRRGGGGFGGGGGGGLLNLLLLGQILNSGRSSGSSGWGGGDFGGSSGWGGGDGGGGFSGGGGDAGGGGAGGDW